MPAEYAQASRGETREATNPQSPSDRTGNPSEKSTSAPREIGGPKGLEPTRHGDWERAGRCVDF
jgi:hypothetical protein